MLELSAAEREGWLVLVAAGRVDSTTADELESALAPLVERRPARLALDLTAVDHVSSPGLRVLLTTLKAVSHHGGTLCLVGPNEHVRKVLHASGIARLFDIRDSLEAG
jgi:anti-sigma B factor antagonist